MTVLNLKENLYFTQNGVNGLTARAAGPLLLISFSESELLNINLDLALFSRHHSGKMREK